MPPTATLCRRRKGRFASWCRMRRKARGLFECWSVLRSFGCGLSGFIPILNPERAAFTKGRGSLGDGEIHGISVYASLYVAIEPTLLKPLSHACSSFDTRACAAHSRINNAVTIHGDELVGV